MNITAKVILKSLSQESNKKLIYFQILAVGTLLTGNLVQDDCIQSDLYEWRKKMSKQISHLSKALSLFPTCKKKAIDQPNQLEGAEQGPDRVTWKDTDSASFSSQFRHLFIADINLKSCSVKFIVLFLSSALGLENKKARGCLPFLYSFYNLQQYLPQGKENDSITLQFYKYLVTQLLSCNAVIICILVTHNIKTQKRRHIEEIF